MKGFIEVTVSYGEDRKPMLINTNNILKVLIGHYGSDLTLANGEELSVLESYEKVKVLIEEAIK